MPQTTPSKKSASIAGTEQHQSLKRSLSSPFQTFARKYFDDLKKVADTMDYDTLEKAKDLIWEAYQNDKTIFVFGNGGSAGTASHLACDFGKGITRGHSTPKNVRHMRVICLSENMSTLTAYGNDMGYDTIFSEPLKNLVRAGDVIIAISASGNSPNVIKAVEVAQAAGAKVIGMAGFKGGKLAKMADACITAGIDNYEIPEDIHLSINHILKSYFYEILG